MNEERLDEYAVILLSRDAWKNMTVKQVKRELDKMSAEDVARVPGIPPSIDPGQVIIKARAHLEAGNWPPVRNVSPEDGPRPENDR